MENNKTSIFSTKNITLKPDQLDFLKNKTNIKNIKYHFEFKKENVLIIKLLVDILFDDGKIIQPYAVCYLYDNGDIYLHNLYAKISKIGIGTWMLKTIITKIYNKFKYIYDFNNNSIITLNTHNEAYKYYEKVGFELENNIINNKIGHYINMSAYLSKFIDSKNINKNSNYRKCKKYNTNSSECRKQNCWYYYDTKKCKPRIK